MFKMTGRGGPADRPEAVRLLEAAVKLGHVLAAYDLALLYLEGQSVTRDVNRAAELMTMAAKAGNPEAQYALATFYKEGRGVPKDLEEAARLLVPFGARGQHRCAGRIRHRLVQRHRRRQERGRRGRIFHQGGRRRAAPRHRPGSP